MHKAEQAATKACTSTAVWPLRLPKRIKGRDLRSQILRLRQTADKDELRKLHEDSMIADISYIRTKADEKEPSALFLMDQCF